MFESKLMHLKYKIFCLLISCNVLSSIGCIGKSENEVVVYSALDREFSEPILKQFEQQTEITVLPKFDIESTKTVGLVSAIIQERNRPRCDLFWNNEILHTLRLERMGILEVYLSPAAEDFPSNYVSSNQFWHGFAARARILIINENLLPNPSEWPRSIEDLSAPKWRGKVAIAKPLFGTTATHAAILFDHWGPAKAKTYYDAVYRNADVLSGNKQVALAVARGQYAFGITDTDDAIVERENGAPVAIVFPDQGEGEMGTLFIPNSLAIIKNSANTTNAKRLVDYLLTRPVETALCKGPSAQFPINQTIDAVPRVAPKEPVRWMQVDFYAAADQWDAAAIWLRDRFQTD